MTRQTSTFLDVLAEWVLTNNCLYFTRQALVNDTGFMNDIVSYVTQSKTPESQVDYLLQAARDLGIIDYVDYNGTYRVKNSLT